VDVVANAAGHGLHERRHVEFAAPADRHDMAVAQNRAAVGQADDLVEPMRDVDDGDTLLSHAAEHAEQTLDFVALQRRRRLVEDQHTAPAPQGLAYGDELALAKRQLPDGTIGVRRKIEDLQSLAGFPTHARAIEPNREP
jgi:hypothetical protein